MEDNDTRIGKLRKYLFKIIDKLVTNTKYQINADFLGNVGDYSLDKIPTSSEVYTWINGSEIHRDVYSFRSRKEYSQEAINNLLNIGFFEEFESIIKSNNRKGILPDIDGIESIECLNCGALNRAETKTAVFDIQIQITYRMKEREEISL